MIPLGIYALLMPRLVARLKVPERYNMLNIRQTGDAAYPHRPANWAHAEHEMGVRRSRASMTDWGDSLMSLLHVLGYRPQEGSPIRRPAPSECNGVH